MDSDPRPLDDGDDGEDEELSEAERLLGRERFSQARFDMGYEREDVDALVEALRSAYVETGRIDGVIEVYALRTTGFREGYEVSEVEEWLAELVEATDTELGERPGPVATVEFDPVAAARTPRRSGAGETSPSAITEHKGLFARFHRGH